MSKLSEFLDKQKAKEDAERAKQAQSVPLSPTPVQSMGEKDTPEPATVPGVGGLLASLRARNLAKKTSENATSAPVQPIAGTNGSGINPTPQTLVGDKPSPELGSDEVDTLRKNLAFLAANLDEKELIGQVVRTTVEHLRKYPQLASVTSDGDVDLIVAAARRSWKHVARKKEEKTERGKKREQSFGKIDQLMKDLGDIEL